MTIFSYVALKNNRDVVKGKVEANDLRSAREAIRQLGFVPTKVYEEKARASIDEKAVKKEFSVSKMKKLGLS